MPYLTHPNGQSTYYADDDFADPWVPHDTILIQHGYGRNANFWFQWIPVLAKHYRVIRRDARGHGRSSIPGADYPYTVDTVLDEIVDTLDQLGLQKVHWLGESTGGIWGELLAARHPARVHSLAICGSPLSMPACARTYLAFGHGTPWDALRTMTIEAYSAAALKALWREPVSDAFAKWWTGEFARSSGNALADHGELLWDASFDARPVMAQIRCAMLLLSPGDSALVDLADQEKLRRAVKGAQQEIVQSASHEIYLDQAEFCQGRYVKFLKGVVGEK